MRPIYVLVTPKRRLTHEEAQYVETQLYDYGIARGIAGVYGTTDATGGWWADWGSPFGFTERSTLSRYADHPGAGVQLQLAGVAIRALDRLGIEYTWRASDDGDTKSFRE